MNDYGKELCFKASTGCRKAYKILDEIDYNIAWVEGAELEYQILSTVKDLLLTLNEEYYQKSQEGEL